MPPLLRPGLLEGLAVTLAAPGAPSVYGSAIARRCGELGAAVTPLRVDATDDEAQSAPVDVLVWDAADAHDARSALDGAWAAIRPAVADHMTAGGGKLVLVAPPPAGAQAAAARAGLENLARTTSIEWARLQIRPVAVLPGAATAPCEVAELAAYVASGAGDYYSGCAFALGAATPG